MKFWNVRAALFAGGLLFASMAQAGTVTGKIDAALTLLSACQVNGSSATTGANFGTLDFGRQDSLFSTAGSQVLRGGGAMSILCSKGTIPVIKVGVGSNDGTSTGGTRALADGSGNFVPYDFYTDAGHSQVFVINGTIALPTSTGVAQTVNLYGRAVGKAGLSAGVYTDIVSVELSF